MPALQHERRYRSFVRNKEYKQANGHTTEEGHESGVCLINRNVHFIPMCLSVNKRRAGVRWTFVVSVEYSWLHANEHEEGQHSGRGTPDGVIVAVALAVMLASVSGARIATALRVAVVMRVLDVLGDLVRPVVCRGQTIMWAAAEVWEGGEDNDG